MNKPSSLKRFLSAENGAPAVFFILSLLSFGLLIPSLGYYMDDWAYVFYFNLKGAEGLREMLTYDIRPNAAWLYILGFKTLGSNPLAWHVMSLLMHWGIVVTLWALIRSIWPQRKMEAIQASLLFAVFPFFMIQPFPVGYTHIWFGFVSFNLSLLLMVWVLRSKVEPWKAILLTAAAVVLEAAHLFTGEYFVGLELLTRPVIVWILLSREQSSPVKKAWKSLLGWLPYLAMTGIFAYWRVFIYENPPDIKRNLPVVLNQFSSEPLKAIWFLINSALGDAFAVIVVGWQKAADAVLVNFPTPFSWFRLAIALLVFFVAFLYLSSLRPAETETKDDWKAGSLTLALSGLLTGGLPIWLTGRAILESKNLLSASRFGIPATFAAAILTFLILDWFIADNRKKIIALSILAAVAANFHLANTKEFQYSWEKQERLARELAWRAPRIEPGSAILTDEEVLGMMGEYAVSFSLNTTYGKKGIEGVPPYWYFPFYYTNPNIGDLLQGVPLEYSKLSMNFSGNSKQMLLLSFNPELKRCLWVMQPQDANLRLVSDDMRKLSAGSDINLIGQGESSLPESIYGEQSTQTWCYYFEKADLARQYSQWDEVAKLWEESQAIGERADNGFEYIPFIEGYGHLEDWEYVKKQTKFANKITAGLEPSLCSMLDRLAAGAPVSTQRDETINSLKDDLKCGNYQ
jgi:hypothetical protein